jgi:hypothetical protein
MGFTTGSVPCVDNLYDWAATAAEAAGTPPWTASREAVQEILDLSRDTAHGVTRPAAPVGSFIAGVAVGLAGAGDLEALRGVVAALRETIPPPAEP